MKIICFLSLLFVVNLTFAKKGNNLIVEARYAIDSNSSWNITDLNSKTFYSFDKNNNLNIGYNKDAAVWCFLKSKITTPKTV